jgi:hypothetical protein
MVVRSLPEYQKFSMYNSFSPSPLIQTERGTLKDQFISKKQACRSNIKALPPQLALLKEKELKDLQEEYREVDNDFKQLGMFPPL